MKRLSYLWSLPIPPPKFATLLKTEKQDVCVCLLKEKKLALLCGIILYNEVPLFELPPSVSVFHFHLVVLQIDYKKGMTKI